LSDPHPLDCIDLLIEHLVRLVCERGGDDFLNTGFSRGVGNQSGINTVSGNDSENFRRSRLQL